MKFNGQNCAAKVFIRGGQKAGRLIMLTVNFKPQPTRKNIAKMATQIIRQPDGLFCVFSTMVDGFIWVDATPEEIIEAEVAKYRERITEQVTKVCKLLDAGESPHAKGVLTYEQAKSIHEERHGHIK